MSSTTAQPRPASVHALRSRWPTLAGVGVAVLTAYDLVGGVDLAPVLAASAVVYLGAAALRKPSAAWLVFFGTFAVITATKLGAGSSAATWALIGVAAVFLVYGLMRGLVRPVDGVPLQAAAMVGFGALAVTGFAVDPTAGAYVVAAGLLGHAAWDAYHHHTGKVVARSLAEFCFVLDTLLALAIVVVTLRG